MIRNFLKISNKTSATNLYLIPKNNIKYFAEANFINLGKFSQNQHDILASLIFNKEKANSVQNNLKAILQSKNSSNQNSEFKKNIYTIKEGLDSLLKNLETKNSTKYNENNVYNEENPNRTNYNNFRLNTYENLPQKLQNQISKTCSQQVLGPINNLARKGDSDTLYQLIRIVEELNLISMDTWSELLTVCVSKQLIKDMESYQVIFFTKALIKFFRKFQFQETSKNEKSYITLNEKFLPEVITPKDFFLFCEEVVEVAFREETSPDEFVSLLQNIFSLIEKYRRSSYINNVFVMQKVEKAFVTLIKLNIVRNSIFELKNLEGKFFLKKKIQIMKLL